MKGRWFLVPIWLILIIVFYFGGKQEAKKNRKLFLEFDSANIKGRLEEVRVGNKVVIFKADNMKDGVVFSPNTGPLNDYEIFEYFAKPGDTIIKPSHSDTLRLKKKGKEYLFTFDKPE